MSSGSDSVSLFISYSSFSYLLMVTALTHHSTLQCSAAVPAVWLHIPASFSSFCRLTSAAAAAVRRGLPLNVGSLALLAIATCSSSVSCRSITAVKLRLGDAALPAFFLADFLVVGCTSSPLSFACVVSAPYNTVKLAYYQCMSTGVHTATTRGVTVLFIVIGNSISCCVIGIYDGFTGLGCCLCLFVCFMRLVTVDH